MKNYYIYILASKKNGTLYIGMTNELERRMKEHKLKEVEGFTKRYDITQLVYFETHKSSFAAFKRERQMKAWKRQWKIDLIEKNNMEWEDLSKDWDV